MKRISPYLRDEHQVFYEAARLGSLSRAAEALGVGQPAISKLIKGLEHEAGTVLFMRESRGVRLTAAGEKLRAQLESFQKLWRENAAQAPGATPVLRLGGHRAVLAAHAPPVLTRLLKQEPAARVEFEFGNSQEITRRVASHELDCGIVVNHVRAPGLVARKLSEDFQAVWRLPGATSRRIAYNPEMMDKARMLRKLTDAELFPVGDYHLILALTLSGECQGILPNTLVVGTGLRIVGEPLRRVQVSLIYSAAQAGPALSLLRSLKF